MPACSCYCIYWLYAETQVYTLWERVSLSVALFEPREFTPGMWFRLYLERTDRTQSDVVAALEQSESTRQGGLRARSRARVGWRWTIHNLALDAKRLSKEEYVAVAKELRLSEAETLRFLRSADIYPTQEEIASAVATVRPLMTECPWPAYVTTYRLDSIIAWNDVTAAMYQLGQAGGADLSSSLPSGKGKDASVAQLDLVTTLLDPEGPIRPLFEAAGHDEWLGLMRQQLGYFMSYWEPLQIWGEPEWMKSILRKAMLFPEFADLWHEAKVERLRGQYGSNRGTTRGWLYDRLQLKVGALSVLVEIHTVMADPRLELLVQVPQDRHTALALLGIEPAAHEAQ